MPGSGRRMVLQLAEFDDPFRLEQVDAGVAGRLDVQARRAGAGVGLGRRRGCGCGCAWRIAGALDAGDLGPGERLALAGGGGEDGDGYVGDDLDERAADHATILQIDRVDGLGGLGGVVGVVRGGSGVSGCCGEYQREAEQGG